MSLRYMVTPQSPSGVCLEFPSWRLRAPSGDRASKIDPLVKTRFEEAPGI